MDRIQLGKKIKQLRLDRGLTQTELGKRIGVSYRQIQKYENGSNYVLASRLYDLAKDTVSPVNKKIIKIAQVTS